MNSREMQTFLHENIPLSRAMGVAVVRLDASGARLRAPLRPNRNHHGTGFGGSLSVLGVLAGWAVVQGALHREGVDSRLVIQRHEVDFTAPAEGDLEAFAPAPGVDAWRAYLQAYGRRGRARLDVRSEFRSDGRPIGSCLGRYVALRLGRPGSTPDEAER